MRTKFAVAAALVAAMTFSTAPLEAGKKPQKTKRRPPQWNMRVDPFVLEEARREMYAEMRADAAVRAARNPRPAAWTNVTRWEIIIDGAGYQRAVPYVDPSRNDAAAIAERAEIERVWSEHVKQFPMPPEWKVHKK